jgi:predicted regulator of Ras-like GTPase activity (Roadblock/LC7/MglB family)
MKNAASPRQFEIAVGIRATATTCHMFGFFKSLFSENRPGKVVSNSSTPVLNPVKQQKPDDPVRSALAPPPPNSAPCLDIPLQPLMDRFPSVLRQKLARPAKRGELVKVPRAAALEQLPLGAVKISFGELKRASPAGLFGAGSELDEIMVELPLREVISCLGPDHLAPRSGQQRISVPDDTAGVFRARGADHLTEAKPLQPAPAAAAAPDHDRYKESQAMASLNTCFPSAPKAPAVPTPQPPTVHRSDPDTLKVALVAVSRSWPDEFRRRILSTHLSASLHIPFSLVESAMKRGKAAFPWHQLRSWIVPQLLAGNPEEDAMSLELPLSLLAPLFLEQRSTRATSAKRMTVAEEIPNVFQARKSAAAGSEERAVADGLSTRSGPAASLQKIVPAQPGSMLAPIRTDLAKPGLQVSGLGQTLLAPDPAGSESRQTTGTAAAPVPTEVVRHACQLTGVTGALLATLDGLVIASELPRDYKAETLAGFLPEMYGRLRQYTQALGLGDPRQVEMLAGDLPLLIHKTSSAYFTVLGKAGEEMPKLQLGALASRLNSRTK